MNTYKGQIALDKIKVGLQYLDKEIISKYKGPFRKRKLEKALWRDAAVCGHMSEETGDYCYINYIACMIALINNCRLKSIPDEYRLGAYYIINLLGLSLADKMSKDYEKLKLNLADCDKEFVISTLKELELYKGDL